MGRVDAADTLYRQVAEADPRNSIAVVGLARIALERGDEAGALELARRALAIDPENAAARRMVARLDEVLTYRAAAAGSAGAPVRPSTIRPAPEPEPSAPTADPGPTIRPDPPPTPHPPTTMRASGSPADPSEPSQPTAGVPGADAPQKRRSWLDRLPGRDP